MKQPEYLREFPDKRKSSSPDSIRAEALKQALDIRKFEIDLYWKRTAYFWAFIALMFTGYFQILTHRANLGHLTDELLLLCSALGMFLSACWFCVNKASKYWQENWERHVDWLEDKVMGPLYKRILAYGKGKAGPFCPLKPYPFSVSKINQLISFAIGLAWGYLFAGNVLKFICKYFISCKLLLDAVGKRIFLIKLILILIIWASLIVLLLGFCKTSSYQNAFGKNDEFRKRGLELL
jgi:hypothetical protein